MCSGVLTTTYCCGRKQNLDSWPHWYWFFRGNSSSRKDREVVPRHWSIRIWNSQPRNCLEIESLFESAYLRGKTNCWKASANLTWPPRSSELDWDCLASNCFEMFSFETRNRFWLPTKANRRMTGAWSRDSLRCNLGTVQARSNACLRDRMERSATAPNATTTRRKIYEHHSSWLLPVCPRIPSSRKLPFFPIV